MNVLHYMRIIARALDYAKDPDPKHWKTINGSHVHLDKNGNYDGGAGSKFNGRHHYGPDWRQKSALMNRLAAALHGGVAKGQAQGQNVAPKATQSGGGNGTMGSKGAPFTSQEWKYVESSISANHVAPVPVNRHLNTINEDEIIRRLAGGDKTKGSCASVALAYIANKCGFDVLDFRGGASQYTFSKVGLLRRLCAFDGIRGKRVLVKKELAGAIRVLNSLDKGKEYYFTAGKHAAIVRRTDKRFEYLELQASGNGNGWKHLNVAELRDRFGVIKSQRTFAGTKMESSVIVIEADSFKGSKEFEEIIKYFNTNSSGQKKGDTGHVK